jgi:hypothetical protein
MAGIISTTGDVKSTVVGDIGLSVYSTLDSLPTSALTSGDQAFVSENNRIYVSNGTGWYNVALLNATPTLSISPSGAVTLATDGSTPTVITLTATDSDNAVAGLTYTVESDGSFADIATLSQDSSVFTITPLSEGAATPGSSTLTFKVSDGISFGSGTTEFSLTFGPDWTTATESKLTASDAQATDYFGWQVAISADGNYAIVGANREDTGAIDAGAAYIFVRSGSTWTQQAKIQASNKGESDEFGYSVSINSDGSYAIIGAPSEDGSTNTIAGAGAAYIFTRSGSTWTEQTILRASNAGASDAFGESVSINSDATYAVVGAWYENTTGAMYVFTRSGSTWTQQAGPLRATDFGVADRFGKNLSINGDGTYIIIGAHTEAPGGVSNGGAAYIWVRSGSSWTHQQKLTASDVATNYYFGEGVAISSDGNYAIVGAVRSLASGLDAGAAYVFTRSGSTWTEQAILTTSDAQLYDNIGRSVSINSDGTFAIVGAPNEDTGGSDAGAAYVFTRSGSTWTQEAKIQASNKGASDQFGVSLSINSDGTYAIIGAFVEDTGGSNAGAAYIYES